MKQVSVIVLVIVGLMFAAYADAAGKKRRTRNANRIGPYAGVLIGQDNYTSDQTETEDLLLSAFNGLSPQNLRLSTKNTDIGYQAAFGYRFSRYLSGEIGLAQYGDVSSTARATVTDTTGTADVTLKLNFSVGGPVMSAVGYLPLGDKFELFARAGVLFASSEREFTSRVDGQSGAFGNAKGDSTEFVMGAGFGWHINQMYTIRAEYSKIDQVGDPNRSGTEDLTCASLGLMVRF